MKPPAIQFYFSDFLASTIHMTHGERGLYIMLLGTQWTQGYVTESDFARAARGLGESDSVDIVRSKFQKGDDGHLRQGRMESEREKQLAFRNERAESGRRGAIAKAQLQLSQSSASAQLKPPSPSPSPSPISNTVTNTVKTVRFAPPTLSDVRIQAAKIGLPELEADAFLNYYEANGWRVGRNPMKSWTAALNNWKKIYDERTHTHRGAGYGKPTPADIRNSRIIGADEVRERERRAAADDAAGLTKMPYEPDYVSPRAQRLVAEAADKVGRIPPPQG